MKKRIYTTLLFVMISVLAFSQQLTQTLRGTIIDNDSKLPLIGATVKIAGSNPLIGTTTDVNGVPFTGWSKNVFQFATLEALATGT